MRSRMGALAERARANLSLSRRWLGHWRRRYMWLRLVILVLIFAHPVYGVFRPIVRDLVVLAIKGIESAKQGPYFEAREIRFQQKKRLQRSLLAYFDRNADGRLDRAESQRLTKKTGLTRGEIAGSGLRVELDPLVEASHRIGLLSRTTSANDMRREALTRALAEREQEHEALWREIGPDLAMQYPSARDYLRWETWKRGLDAARGQIVGHLGLTLGSAFAGLTPSEYDSMWMEPRPRWWGAVGWLGLGLVTVLCIRRYGRGEELARRFREEPELAAAACPVCGVPTRDYGSLPQHRTSRAWATAAVVGLALVTMAAVGWLEALRGLLSGTREPSGFDLRQVLAHMYSGSLSRTMEDSWAAVLVLAAACGVARWVLWPREVHAIHRRSSLRLLGFAVGTLLAVGLLSSITGFTMRMFDWPRGRVVAIAGPKQRGRGADKRGERHEARVRSGAQRPPKLSPPAAKPERRGRMRGAADADRSERRALSSDRRRRDADGRAGRGRSRRGSRDRGRDMPRGNERRSR